MCVCVYASLTHCQHCTNKPQRALISNQQYIKHCVYTIREWPPARNVIPMNECNKNGCNSIVHRKLWNEIDFNSICWREYSIRQQATVQANEFYIFIGSFMQTYVCLFKATAKQWLCGSVSPQKYNNTTKLGMLFYVVDAVEFQEHQYDDAKVHGGT